MYNYKGLGGLNPMTAVRKSGASKDDDTTSNIADIGIENERLRSTIGILQ